MKGNPPSKPGRSEPRGSFEDLEALFEQLATSPIIELGNPLPDEKFLTKRPRVGRCPAAHNKALLDDELLVAAIGARKAPTDNNHDGC